MVGPVYSSGHSIFNIGYEVVFADGHHGYFGYYPVYEVVFADDH